MSAAESALGTTTPRSRTSPLAGMRLGLARGWIELRHTLTNRQDLTSYLFPAALMLTVMVFLRGTKVPGTTFSLGSMTLPSVVGASLGYAGMNTMAALLSIEREDGTLLRAKAIPNGMTGYLVGKIVTVSGMILLAVGLELVPGLFLFSGLTVNRVGSWLMLLALMVLGLVATLPLGAIAGSLIANPRSLNASAFLLMGLVSISGIFYPITHLPQWLQWIGQCFPLYWLGLGLRSALLPGSLASVEIDGSWRHWETFGVLAGWAVVGVLIAPTVLRRMARRESGANMATRRDRALQRLG